MTNQNEHNDELFRELFKQRGIEKAPEGFADKVMSAIEAETEPSTEKWWALSGLWLWGSIVFGFICLVGMVFFIDFSFMGSIVAGIEVDGSLFTQFIQQFGTGMASIFENFNISTITISILVALVFLFIIDRLFRRKPSVEMRMI